MAKSNGSEFWNYPVHHGIDYLDFIRLLHEKLSPRGYLEIGTLSGLTLTEAKCKSIAIDVKFQLDRDVVGEKPACLLYQMTSDDFFSDVDIDSLGVSLDLIFLDGMHHYEFLLRDFCNAERRCSPSSIIIIHDCLPTDTHIARRTQDDMTLASDSSFPFWWAGDVWKAVYMLLEERPDLKIEFLDLPPTGIVVISNVNPNGKLSSNKYFKSDKFIFPASVSYSDFRNKIDVRSIPDVDAATRYIAGLK